MHRASPPEAPSTLESLGRSFTSWRTAAVTLQSFPSGLPLGLVLVAVPAWLALEGIDIRTIGFVTLAQAPWTFKFLWSPFLDRFAPPFLGRKRGWAVVAQAGILVTTLALAALALEPERVWLIAGVTFLIAFASATQDIAIDAYAVEVLHREEQGVAAGARSAVARFAFFLSGRVVITAAKYVSWPVLFAVQSLVYLPAAILMYFSPEPEEAPAPPSSLRSAVWDPLVDFLRQHRALEITIFLVLYKFGDNLASALVSPFLIQVGYDQIDVGVASGTIGLVGTIVGSILGGTITSAIGLGHSLWLFGLLQAFSNIGYVLIAQAGVNRLLMYGAIAVETGTSGMGTGAFSVLLLRLTQKKFSATQYALLSSIFALGRTVAGPLAGVLVDAIGWRVFFILTIFAAAPGLIMLQRFVPFGEKEPTLGTAARRVGGPVARRALLARALGGTALGVAVALVFQGMLDFLRSSRGGAASVVSPWAPLFPASPGDWISLLATLLFGLVCGLMWAAMAAARRGVKNSRFPD
jgi:PAT family beta-lactamase induction signal transducer AmpG